MFRFAKGVATLALLTIVCGVDARAQETIVTPDLNAHLQRFSVTLNGVDVSEKSAFYMLADGTLYAGAPDLAAWKLRYAQEPDFVRDGVAYYGLQTTLNLAVAVTRPQERLNIIAPPAAFIGGPKRERPIVTPGGGSFLNYRANYYGGTEFSPARTIGDYNLFLTHNASTLQTDFFSELEAGRSEFVREGTSWYTRDVAHHRVLGLGELTMDGGDIGSNPGFVGLHVASDYETDPFFITHAQPSVTGFATSPSLVEVFVDNVLQYRAEVLEGPFVVRNLPASAANSDVTLVLTDTAGHRTTQVVRSNIDTGVLRPGLTSYVVDAGYGETHGSFGEPHAGSLGASVQLRHGLMPWLTLQAMGESVGGDPFAAAGFESRSNLGAARFWYGNGKLRRTGKFDYSFSTGPLTLTESMQFNAQSRPGEFQSVFSNYIERRELSYSKPQYNLRLSQFRYIASNGFAFSFLQMTAGFRIRGVAVGVQSTYDKTSHRLGAVLRLTQALSDTTDLAERGHFPSSSPASGSLEYSKQPRDPDDPWRYDATAEFGSSLERRLSVEDTMSWAVGRFAAGKTDTLGQVTGDLEGALGVIGGIVAPLRDRYQENTIGIARLPGFPGVRIDVNGSPAGYTDRNGNLVLKSLSTLQENVVSADLSSIPLAVSVTEPAIVVPLPATPVSVGLLQPKAQSVSARIVDARGLPLPPGSFATAEDGTRFPIGFEGRAFLYGLTAGEHVFSSGGCTFSFRFEPRWEIIDAGTLVCRGVGPSGS